jgi:hypothetical protein
VLLDDGSWLSCQNAVDFNNAPFGPFQLGPNGDIALYVTDISSPDGVDKPQLTLRDPAFGDRITYVPAARIKRITVRYLRKPSRSWLAAVFGRSQPEQGGPLAAP